MPAPRLAVVLSLVLGACRPGSAAPAVQPEVTSAAERPAPTVSAPRELEVEVEVEVEASVQRWTFTTLVTGGSEALIGANGYYTLEREGDTWTVRKMGERGTPEFPPHRVLEASATASPQPSASWPDAQEVELDVVLTNDSATRPMQLRLMWLDDELHGTWFFPHERHERQPEDPSVGRLWGLLRGQRGDAAPAALRDGADTPCNLCVQAFYSCEGTAWQEPGCNSASMADDACQARISTATRDARPVPRGCGDWME